MKKRCACFIVICFTILAASCSSADITIYVTATSISDDSFIAYGGMNTYRIICDNDGFCIGDMYKITYKNRDCKMNADNQIEVTPVKIEIHNDNTLAKPVIYLYPPHTAKVSVRLNLNGRFTVTEPLYENGWTVTAQPDGTLTAADGTKYPYLYWEAACYDDIKIKDAFCVENSNTQVFLTQTLQQLGLNDAEAADFMEYWLPYLQQNPYNLISFSLEQYEENVQMQISPQPNSVIRVFMTFKPVNTLVETTGKLPQSGMERRGFTVVEWGGTRI